MLEAVVFDMDGLLIDSEPLWQQAEIEVFAGVGIQLDRRMCLRTRGRKLTEVIDYWYRENPWSGASKQEIRDAVRARLLELVRERGRPKEGVAHVLDFFARRKAPLGIASTSDYAVIEAVLDCLGVADRFRAIHSGQDEPLGKPHPGVFLGAARKLGVAPERCLAFEDSPAGVRSAKSAGMCCVAVPDAGTFGSSARMRAERERLAQIADLVIDSLRDFDDVRWSRLGGSPR